MNSNTIYSSIALTFFLIGLTGISIGVYVSVYGYDGLSHSAVIKTTEQVIGIYHDYNS